LYALQPGGRPVTRVCVTDLTAHGSLDSVTARPARADAVRELYDGCYRRLVGQLYALTWDLGEAQDAVQEAFVRALAAPRRFARLDNPEAWLRVVAVNVARRRMRRHAHLDRLLRRDPPPVQAVPGLSPDHVAVVAALRKLPPAQAEAIALHHLADLRVSEIAELTGVAEGTVKARLSRGRARLAELLADEPEPDLEVPDA
jgi:RNA polymerase sigma factor (sigma-70 family)